MIQDSGVEALPMLGIKSDKKIQKTFVLINFENCYYFIPK